MVDLNQPAERIAGEVVVPACATAAIATADVARSNLAPDFVRMCSPSNQAVAQLSDAKLRLSCDRATDQAL
jgi:hypothetical protein